MRLASDGDEESAMLDRHRDGCGTRFQPCLFGGVPHMWSPHSDDQRARERAASA